MYKIFFFLIVAASFAACGGSGEQPANQLPYKPTGIKPIDQLSEQIVTNPNKAELYFERSKAYYENDLFAESVADAERATQLDSTNPQYYRQLANAYFDNNQSRPAIKTLDKAMAAFPNETYFYLMASEIQLITEQYNEALISVDKLLKLEPYNAEALFMRGQVYKYMGDTLQAMMNYQKAVEQDADHLNSYLQLSILSGKMNHPLSLQYLDNALRIDSINITALMQKAWFFHNQAKYDDAKTWYEKAILHHPQNADPVYNVGHMFLEQAEQMAKKNPEKAKEFLGQAQKYFDSATKFDATFGEAYYYRGLTKERLGDKEGAWQDYDQALVFETLLQAVSPKEIEEAMKRVKN